jgi:hypothetical protein
MIRCLGCPRLRRQPWTTDTRDLRARDPGLRVLMVVGTAMSNRSIGSWWPGAPSAGARVGGVGAILDRGSRRPGGDAPLPASPLPAGPDHRSSRGRARASRAAVPRWLVGKMTDPGVRCEMLALPSRTRGRARPVERKATARAHRGVEERDHRIVASAPGRDGLVEDERAPASGTAVRATTVFGTHSQHLPGSPPGSFVRKAHSSDRPGRTRRSSETDHPTTFPVTIRRPSARSRHELRPYHQGGAITHGH